MGKDRKFTVEIRSRSDQWWRYNAAMMCGAFDQSGNRVGFSSVESRVADMGEELKMPPAGVDMQRKLSLETVPCDRIVLYIYVIPHTLPRDNEIGGHPPFPLQVKVAYGPYWIGSMRSTSGEGLRSNSKLCDRRYRSEVK